MWNVQDRRLIFICLHTLFQIKTSVNISLLIPRFPLRGKCEDWFSCLCLCTRPRSAFLWMDITRVPRDQVFLFVCLSVCLLVSLSSRLITERGFRTWKMEQVGELQPGKYKVVRLCEIPSVGCAHVWCHLCFHFHRLLSWLVCGWCDG